MADVAFYHLTRSRADDALPPLLAKTLAAEKRAFVCCSKEKFGPLSTAIWSRQPDSWLPHGMSGTHDSAAESCPIWLSDKVDDNGNNADFLFFIDAQAPDDLPPAERIFIIFDGTDEDIVSKARNQWQRFDGAGHALSYWQQDDAGKWSRAR